MDRSNSPPAPSGTDAATVEFLPNDPPGEEAVERLRAHAAVTLAPIAALMAAQPKPNHVVGSSKAIRSLAKLAGYPAAGWSGSERMLLPRTALGSWIPRLARLPASARQELPGITPDRTFQIVAAAVVLHTAMTALGVEELEVSPWALREGVLLRYIESLVYQAVAENMASEQSARMVAMKAASDNAKKVIDELQLSYNKARQAAITKELSEIVGGAAAV